MRSSLRRVTRKVQTERFDYVVYTDGACKGNPGPGGWGCVGFEAGIESAVTLTRISFQRCGGQPATTNNRMELMGVIEALKELSNPAYATQSSDNEAVEPPNVLLVIDSKYVLQGITDWVDGWQRRAWLTADKQPVKNVDLWKQLLALVDNFQSLTWCWVKGHSGDYGNELADKLSNDGVDQARTMVAA